MPSYSESTYIFKFTRRPSMYEEHTFTFPEKTGPATFFQSWSFKVYNVWGKFTAGGSSNIYFALPYTQNIRVKGGILNKSHNFGKLHIEMISESSTSAKVRYWVKCYHPRDWYNGLTFTGTLSCRTENVVAPTDSKPTGLLCEGSIEPLAMANPNPSFSAIFNDLNGTAKETQIQVRKTIISGQLVWDSGWIARSVSDGKRCKNIIYAGAALDMNSVNYYWKIRFKDTADSISDWSDEAHFKTSDVVPPPPKDDAPTDLLCEGESFPVNVTDQNPEFSAINNMVLTTTDYQIIVSKVLLKSTYLPAEPYVWDSGWQPDSTAPGSRCSNKTFGGNALPIDDTRYYWAIRFRQLTIDAELVSEWSLAASFIMSDTLIPPPTVAGYYRIQVNTRQDMQGTMLWDSGNIVVSTGFTDGQRSPDFEYGVTGLPLDLSGRTTYYWRVKLWNADESEGPWSTELAYFRGPVGGPPGPTPPPDWVTAQYREPIGKVEVEKEAGSGTFTELVDAMGISISNNKNPLDNIETAQATIYLSNIDKKFYSENAASEFYEKLEGRRIRIYVGAKVSGVDLYYQRMIGIVKSVNVNRNAHTAEIVALEFLDYYKTRKIRRTPVYLDLTVFDLFCELVRYCFPNWKNQREVEDWDYYVDELGFRRTNIYIGVGDGSADYVIKDYSKTPPEVVHNIIPDTEAIYKNGFRLFRGTDYSITQREIPLGTESTLHFLRNYPTSSDILYASVTIATLVEAIQYEDTSLIEELEKIATVADCRIYADINGKLVCKSNALINSVDSIAENTHLLSLSSRKDIDSIVNHVVVESKPWILAGERKSLGSWDIAHSKTYEADNWIEYTFEFGEYATDLIFDLNWSITLYNVWGTYVGAGTEEDFTLPADIRGKVRGLWGPQTFGEMQIRTVEVDAYHITIKFRIHWYHYEEWYTGMKFDATLTVKGITVGQPVTYIGEAVDEASFQSMWIGEKPRTFTLEYLEPGIEAAQQAAESLLSILSKLTTYYDCLVRGMPHLRLLDTVKITSAAASLSAKEMQVIKLIDSLKVGDYKTNLGLMIKTVPVVVVPDYWTPEWHEFYMRSEADETQTFTWGFRTEIIGRFFRHEWTLKLHHPKFAGLRGEFSGANYNIEDLPYTETLKVTFGGDPKDFADLEITLVSETPKTVKVQYKLTLKSGWEWDGYSENGPFGWKLFLQIEYWGKLACIPDFSYEVQGTLSLPHYPPTYPNAPPEDQPVGGYFYELP